MFGQARIDAVALYRSGRYTEAAAAALSHLESHPEDVPMQQMLADCCLGAGYLDEAERLFRHGLGGRRSVFDLTGLAMVLGIRGRTAQAESLLRTALQIEPGSRRAWSELASLHRFKQDDPLLAQLRFQLSRDDLDNKTRRDLHYALSKALDDIGHWNAAWDQATIGASILPPRYNPETLRRLTRDQHGVFDRAFLAPVAGRGLSTEAPIFIVGMPRSGTTLVERVVTATGAVAAMGELPSIPDIMSVALQDGIRRGLGSNHHLWVRRWPAEAFTEAAVAYLRDVGRRNGGDLPTRFVDKLPGNVFFLGQIALMFPKARIIRMHRDPLDCCVSCYLGRFTTGHHYTARPDWLADAWHAHEDSADALVPMLPNPVLDVHYETLVREPERETRRLMGFLGLDWSSNCLSGPGAGYISTTRSRTEVRAAIHTRSVGRWRNYSGRIAPLARSLGIAVDA